MNVAFNYPLRTIVCMGTFVPTVIQAQKDVKPNIIFIYADDMGYADLSCYGETRWKTVNLDKMAEEGILFTDFYSASSLSSPSRAGFMTGRYPNRMGVQQVFFPQSFTGMPQNEVTIAEVLHDRGYRTSLVGKWHLGHHYQFLPLQQGFDEYFGIPYSNDMSATVYLRGNEVEQFHVDQTQTTQTYTREAVNFIKRNRDHPFFLYLAHTMVHVPIHVSSQFEGKSGAGKYGDAVLEMDWSVGEVIRTLRELKLEENTLVIFSSDNGPWLKQGPNGGTALPLLGGKGSDYEGGVRVPCIAYWKGHITPNKNIAVATMLDWMPTFAALSGAELPKGVRLDGYDISKVLLGTGERANQDYAYFRRNKDITAYRSGDWKIELPAPAINGNFFQRTVAARDTVLINLREDISETTNLYHKYPEKAKEMVTKLVDYINNYGDIPPVLVTTRNNQQSVVAEDLKRAENEARTKGETSKKNQVIRIKENR